MEKLIEKIEKGSMPTHDEIVQLLALQGESALLLHRAAHRVKRKILGNKVFLRGLVEFSNVCRCDCLYCGIRKSNEKVARYTLSDAEILENARFAIDHGYGAVVLQSGERNDENFVKRVAEIVSGIKKISADVGITLSCGEETPDTYRLWRESGAERYLLRIETSDAALFQQIHDEKANYQRRRRSLDDLREAGFTVGSGVMIGLPGQTLDQLATDLEFFRDQDLDMIGMGPFLAHGDTPLGKRYPDTEEIKQKRLLLALNMIAVTRLMLRDVNIAAATSLQAISPADGRQRGILAGANVIMPNLGEAAKKRNYRLYDNKPDIDENAKNARLELEKSLQKIGEIIAYRESGTPLHYLKRQ
ncbi:MAG: [FeFe] hydrogenase H-cluster radical SAM maturase HydE [Victivallaceae bacterium]|nr:[FeFe] hydrogenase H-cluster radical SAM maturase HydE [Victivallaceae bacterium]